MIGRLFGAIQFLTIVPISRRGSDAGLSAMFFPLVGAGIGAAGGVLFFWLSRAVAAPVAAGITLTFWAWVTGGLHEDGAADVADGFRAGRSREKILAILKDSRIGAHGALALILTFGIRLGSLTNIAVPPILALAATFAMARAALVLLAWLTPPVGDGLGWSFSQRLSSVSALIALVSAAVFAVLAPSGLLLAWGAFMIVLVARSYFMRRIGGVTGDCLGATALLVETWGLVVYSCRACM